MNVLDLSFFLLGLGATEVIAKPLGKNLFRRSMKLLPVLFDKLDPVMPDQIAKLTPEEMESFIFDTINGAAQERGAYLTEKEKNALFDEFLSKYNPVVAASKVNPQ